MKSTTTPRSVFPSFADVHNGYFPACSSSVVRTLLVVAVFITTNVAMLGSTTPLFAQETPPPNVTDSSGETADAFPDLTLPPNATKDQLVQLVARAKKATPNSPEQYMAMQTAIRDASQQLLKRLDTEKDAAVVQATEMDVITASVSLMTYFSKEEQTATVSKLHEFLKSRKELSIRDIQTGMMAAAMLELQPNKKPSRDTYQLLDDLLAKDERPEMQSLRVNLQAAVRRLNLLGNKLDLEAVALDGTKIDIDDFAGKFVIVDFFATWCEPCLAEIPRLRKQYEKYKEKGLEVIGVSLDGDAVALSKFLEDQNLPWPVIHDNGEKPLDRLQMKFGVSSLPTVMLLNKEGDVVSLEARGAELERLMQLLFESPTPAAAPESATPESATPAAKSDQ